MSIEVSGGRRGLTDPVLSADDLELENQLEALVGFFNGDWTSRILQHVCKTGCLCGGSIALAQAFALSLLLRIIFYVLGQQVPSESRFLSSVDASPNALAENLRPQTPKPSDH